MATFGFTDAGTTEDFFGGGYTFGCLYALPVAGTVTSINVYLKSAAQNNFTCALYNAARARQAVSGEALNTGDSAYHWESYAVNVHLVAASYYIAVGEKAGGGTTYFKYSAGVANQTCWDNQYVPDPLQTDDQQPQKCSIYAEYTPDVSLGRQVGAVLPSMQTVLSAIRVLKLRGLW